MPCAKGLNALCEGTGCPVRRDWMPYAKGLDALCEGMPCAKGPEALALDHSFDHLLASGGILALLTCSV